jgi:hypothetical protein
MVSQNYPNGHVIAAQVPCEQLMLVIHGQILVQHSVESSVTFTSDDWFKANASATATFGEGEGEIEGEDNRLLCTEHESVLGKGQILGEWALLGGSDWVSLSLSFIQIGGYVDIDIVHTITHTHRVTLNRACALSLSHTHTHTLSLSHTHSLSHTSIKIRIYMCDTQNVSTYSSKNIASHTLTCARARALSLSLSLSLSQVSLPESLQPVTFEQRKEKTHQLWCYIVGARNLPAMDLNGEYVFISLTCLCMGLCMLCVSMRLHKLGVQMRLHMYLCMYL